MNTISPVSKFKWGHNPAWALANKKHGRNALITGSLSTIAGCSKMFLNEESNLYKATNLAQSIFNGLRSKEQYSIYSRVEDDDLGKDLHDRPHAGNIGEVACFTEKNINPIALPITALLNGNIYDGYNSIAHYANAMWWRIRLFSKKMDWWGLKTTLSNDIKYLFQKNLEGRKFASENIAENISPLLGLIGFLFTGLFTPIRSWLKFKNIGSRIIDSLTSIGNATQHLVYFFRFSLPELFCYEEFKDKENKILFGLGGGANLFNVLLPAVDLLPNENNFLNKFQKLHRELASGLTMLFFSTRRYFMGREYLVAKRI